MFKLLLWLRRFLLWGLVLSGLIVGALYIAANSPKVIRALLDNLAHTYPIKYTRVQGDLLEGISVEGLSFRDRVLLDRLQFRWRPLDLFRGRISLYDVKAFELDLSVLQDALGRDKKNIADGSRSDTAFIDELRLSNVEVSAAPYGKEKIAWEGVSMRLKRLQVDPDAIRIFRLQAQARNLSFASLRLSRSKLKLDSIFFDRGDELRFKRLDFQARSPWGALRLFAEGEGKDLHLKKINLNQLDFKSLLSLKLQNEQNDSDRSLQLWRRVVVGSFEVRTRQSDFGEVAWFPSVLKGRGVVVDLERASVREGTISAIIRSDHGSLEANGTLSDNRLEAKGRFRPTQKGLDRFSIPLKALAMAPIDFITRIDRKSLEANLSTQGRNPFDFLPNDITLDVKRIQSRLFYRFDKKTLRVQSQAMLRSKFAKSIKVTNDLNRTQTEGIRFGGKVNVAAFENEANLTDLLKDTVVLYQGDEEGMRLRFQSEALQAKAILPGYRKAYIEAKTHEGFERYLDRFLPRRLKGAKLKMEARSKIDFENPRPLKITYEGKGNLLRTKGSVTLLDGVKLEGDVSIPKNSLLRSAWREVPWDRLDRFEFKAGETKKGGFRVSANGKKAPLKVSVVQENDKRIKADIVIDALKIPLRVEKNGAVSLRLRQVPLSTLSEAVEVFYPLDTSVKKVEGKIDLSLRGTKTDGFEFELDAPELRYKPDRRRKTVTIEKLRLRALYHEETLRISNYRLRVAKRTFFSTKESIVAFQKNNLDIKRFVINDSAFLKGRYDVKKQKGQFALRADRFELKEPNIHLFLRPDITIDVTPEEVAVRGEIDVLGGRIEGISAAPGGFTDEDIVFGSGPKLAKQKNKTKDRLFLQIFVKTKSPISFRDKNAKLKLSPELSILKVRGGEIQYTGAVEILPKGRYYFDKKTFFLKRSYIYFTGKLSKPQLDIKVNYKSLDYVVTIAIVGTPAAPRLEFSASPPLKKEQILSLLLFGSVGGGDTYSGNEMMRMMGGAMAKAALSDLGVEIDHLVFGEGGSVEVGKKLNNKTTVVYIEDQIPKIKLIHRHGKHTQSVITVDEVSQSYDIIYKRDVKHLKDTFKRKP